MAGSLLPGRAARAGAAAALGVALLVSASVLAQPSDQAPDQGSVQESPPPAASTLGTGPIASALTPEPADPAFAESIVALGLDEATAAFLARTRSTVEATDAHTYVVRHAFPDGATGEETYHLVQGPGPQIGDPPDVVFAVVDDELHYQLRYALDPAELPPDLRAQVLEGLPVLAESGANVTTPTVRLLGLAPVSPLRAVFAAEAPGTVQVVVDGVVSQGQSKAIDKFVKYGEKQGWTKSAKSYKAYKAGKKVWEAVEANDLISSALDKLKALRKCAEEPTNPLTRKQYEEDSGARQRVLDELTAAENDIRESTVAMFTTLLVSTGSSLVKAAPWLGFITTPANNYVKTTLRSVIEERVRAAEQLVPPCQLSFAISGSAPSKPGGITLSGRTCSLEKPFKVQTQGDLLGTIRFSPTSATGGRWSYSGSETQAGFGVKGSGDYTVSLSEDQSSGSLDFKFVTRLFIPGVGGKSGGGPVSLTLTEIPPCLEAG